MSPLIVHMVFGVICGLGVTTTEIVKAEMKAIAETIVLAVIAIFIISKLSEKVNTFSAFLQKILLFRFVFSNSLRLLYVL